MIRSTFTTVFFLALAAGPAMAETTPAPSPDVAATTDAFGLPCEVTFAPKSATPPAKGAKAKKAKPSAPAPKLATSGLGRGAEFALGRHDRGPSYKPDAESEVRMKAESLTPAMIGIVVRENATAIELCMTKLPKDSRVATVGLIMTIESAGHVSAARVDGAGKATAFSSCLAAAAKTWTFPHTDAHLEIEYPITLNGR